MVTALRYVLLLPILGVTCAIAFAFNYAAIKGGSGLVGVGIATTAVLFIKFTATYFIACRSLFELSESIRHYASYFLKFLFVAGVLFGLQRVWPGADRSLLQTASACGIFGLLYLPLLIRLDRELGMIGMLKKKFGIRSVVPAESLT